MAHRLEFIQLLEGRKRKRLAAYYSKVEPLPEGTWSSDATVREWQLASVRFKFDGGCLPCPATAMRRKSRTDPCDRPSTPHRSHCRPWQGLALRQRRQTRPPAQ